MVKIYVHVTSEGKHMIKILFLRAAKNILPVILFRGINGDWKSYLNIQMNRPIERFSSKHYIGYIYIYMYISFCKQN